MVLCAPASEHRMIRRRPDEIARFRVRDGYWARLFDDAGDWTRALCYAAVAGAPAAGANFLAPTFFLGQKALVTWANALVGAAAATAALKSHRMVRFDAQFDGGHALQGRAEERALMLRLPHIYQAMAGRPR